MFTDMYSFGAFYNSLGCTLRIESDLENVLLVGSVPSSKHCLLKQFSFRSYRFIETSFCINSIIDQSNVQFKFDNKK